jgi:hypothetical protein
MRAFLKQRGEAIQILLGLVVTALAAADLVGKPARLPQLMVLGAGMFSAGVGLGGLAARRRERRRAARGSDT